ncbi:MAG: sialidase family protein [Nocardioides sp.]
MDTHARLGRRRGAILSVAVGLGVVLTAAPAYAAATVAIGSDGYTNADSSHATQVEPDSFAWGSTVMAAAQTGRYNDGGASNINVSVSLDSGATWVERQLPGITDNNTAALGPYNRVSDPVVAYNARFGTWLISTLPLLESGGVHGAAVATSVSTDSGNSWSDPVVIPGSTTGNPDKNWIVCDNTPSSPFYGNCYTEWDDNGSGNLIRMSTSTDGGFTWSSKVAIGGNATGIGGQPVVQPSGTVVVPIMNANDPDPGVHLHQRWRVVELAGLHYVGRAAHRRRQPAGAAAAERRDRRLRQGVRRLAGLPLPATLHEQRHRDDHVDQRDELDVGGPGADRQHHERRRPLHARARRRRGVFGVDRPAGADVLLLPVGELLGEHLPAAGGLRLLQQRRQHLDGAHSARQHHERLLAAEHHAGPDVRRLHLHLVRGGHADAVLLRRHGTGGLDVQRPTHHRDRAVRSRRRLGGRLVGRRARGFGQPQLAERR